MTRFVTALLAALLAATAAHAQTPITLTIETETSTFIDSLNVYPIGADGEAVEDNLGALIDDLPAGDTARLPLSLTACETVRAYIGLGNGSAVSGDIDLCVDPTVTVND